MTAKEARQKTTEGLGALAKKILIMLAIKMIFLIIFVIAVTIFLPRNDLINGIALAVTVVCVKHKVIVYPQLARHVLKSYKLQNR